MSGGKPTQVQTEVFALKGGLDLVSSALAIDSGALIDCVNYELDIAGGYRRIGGYERFDGRPAPSAAEYWTLGVAITGGIAIGDTITGATSLSTARVLAVNGTGELIVTKLSAAFTLGEALKVLGVTQATCTAVAGRNGATTAALGANYKHLAANHYRSDISAPPGTGPIRGVWHYNGDDYAFKDFGAACLMYKATPTGWAVQSFGKEVAYTAWSSIATVSIGSPVSVGWTAHGLANASPVVLTTTGALPTGVMAGVTYYTSAVTADAFSLSLTPGGAALITSGTQSGVHTATLVPSALIKKSTLSGVTTSIGSPCSVGWPGHGLLNATPVAFSTTGALPTGLTAGVTYYTTNGTTDAFLVSATPGGAAVATSGTQSGTHTITIVSSAISEGNTVVGKTSGATGVVTRVTLRTGSWANAPVGTLVFDTITGDFVANEVLKVGGLPCAKTTSASTQIALLAGGRFEFVNHNFGGQADTSRMYFCDGVNLAHEWDGTRLVPIRTGITPDTPKFITAWKNMLVMAINASVQCSGINLPYSWTALTGASELALGDTCTGLLPQVGTTTTGALAVFTKDTTQILYGNTSADFNLVPHSIEAGAAAYTAQNIGVGHYLDAKGVVSLTTTQNFGNFEIATLTHKIQPLIDAKRGTVVASCVLRAKNQYRLFYSDGTALSLYMADGKFGGATLIDYGPTQHMNVVTSFIGTDGAERILAGGSDGMVYSLDIGTSFDGASIPSRIFLSFNPSKSPRIRKRYRRAIMQAVCDNTADVRIGYELDYGSSAVGSGARALNTLVGNGGYWDISTWGAFNWDAPYVTNYHIDTPGNGTSIGLLIFGDSAVNESYVIQSCILHYMYGRQER